MFSSADAKVEDSVLISKALDGDQDAWSMLFSRYHRFLYSLACRTLGGRDDADDAVQNCLVQALRNLQQFNNAGAFRSWLARILVNEAIVLIRKRNSKARFIDTRRSRNEEREVLDELPGPALNPEQVLSRKESLEALTREVKRLSAPLRSVVTLCALQECSLQEAGKTLQVPETTIRSRFFRARRQLAEAIRASECAG
jgi:RNA polymerase sigma-70 factor, ECF subfamily